MINRIKVFGFTEDKESVTTELTFEQFAHSGIHPYRIDLFEPKPVVRKCGGVDLNFTPLKGLCFAFPGDDGRLILAVHHGDSKICLTGNLEVPESQALAGTVRVGAPQLLERSFEDCLCQYLELMHRADDLPPLFCGPLDASSMQMRGTELLLQISERGFFRDATCRSLKPKLRLDYLLRPRFDGEMWKEQQVSVELPQEILWVFEQFSQCQPKVWGEALLNVLNKEQVRRVDVRAEDPDHLQYIGDMAETRWKCRFVKTLNTQGAVSFWHDGVRYNLMQEFSFSRFLETAGNLTSIDGLYSADGKAICGPNIAFSDIGSKLVRFLGAPDHSSRRLRDRRNRRKRALIEEGYTAFEFPIQDKKNRP